MFWTSTEYIQWFPFIVFSLNVCLCAMYVHITYRGWKKTSDSLKLIMDSCETTRGCQKTNPGHLIEQPVFLTIKPSLQPPFPLRSNLLKKKHGITK